MVKVKATRPAKVKPRSTWTLHLSVGCESEAFAAKHAFASTDGNGDAGTDKGKKKLTMTWSAGPVSGAHFTGTWGSNGVDTGAYYAAGADAAPASLTIGATNCLAPRSHGGDGDLRPRRHHHHGGRRRHRYGHHPRHLGALTIVPAPGGGPGGENQWGEISRCRDARCGRAGWT
ncbi:MAG: hypothetical protein ACRDY1_12945 [Acidimicrobiales bacterium]